VTGAALRLAGASALTPFAEARVSTGMIAPIRATVQDGHEPMTTANLTNIDTGYRIAGASINTESGPSGYQIEGERILHGTIETGFFLAGETIYQKPKLDTGFRICGGIIFGPSCELPFVTQRPPSVLSETTKIDPVPAYVPPAPTDVPASGCAGAPLRLAGTSVG
jgi:hypothetical protein